MACLSLLRSFTAALLLPVAAGQFDEGHFYGYVSSKEWLPRVPTVKGPTGEELVTESELPENFDWRDHAGQNWVTSEVNQHIPIYCGGCWIHGSTLTLNDRIKIHREARFPDVQLSRQALLNCVPDPTTKGPPPGCNGGDPWMVYKYLLETKVPDDTCMSYTAENMGCTDMNVCRNCAPKKALRPDGSTYFVPGYCYPVYNWTGYGVVEHGNVSGEVAMMKEIYARGPIACGIAADNAFGARYAENPGIIKEGVYVTDKKYTDDDVDHVMEVAGWGVTPGGTKYWILRNSWGTYWGDQSWIRIRRGANQQLVEASCDWAVPDTEDIDKRLYHVNLAAHFAAKAARGAGTSAAAREPVAATATVSPTATAVAAAVATGALGFVAGHLLAGNSRGSATAATAPLLG